MLLRYKRASAPSSSTTPHPAAAAAGATAGATAAVAAAVTKGVIKSVVASDDALFRFVGTGGLLVPRRKVVAVLQQCLQHTVTLINVC